MSRFPKLFDYTKPGKGLTEEEAELKGLKGFFTVFTQKFWKLIQLNLLFTVFYIPIFFLFYFVSQFIMPGGTSPIPASLAEYPFVAAWNGINISSNLMLSSTSFLTDFVLRIGVFVLLIAFPVIAVGPIQAGNSYILSSFVRANPVFMVSEFFEKAKANFKQSIQVCLIDAVVLFILAIDIRLYAAASASEQGGFFVTFATTLMIMLFIIFLIMHMFVYPLMVTFKMTLKQLYKNSFLLTMASFVPAVGILILDVIILAIPYLFITNPVYYILLALLIMPNIIGLINNYFIRSYVNKYLYEPALKAEEEKRNSGNEDEEYA